MTTICNSEEEAYKLEKTIIYIASFSKWNLKIRRYLYNGESRVDLFADDIRTAKEITMATSGIFEEAVNKLNL